LIAEIERKEIGVGKFERVGSGFIELQGGGFINRINGKEYHKPFRECRPKRYIHIGLHRTGGTFLQWKVFPLYRESELVFSDDSICGGLFDNGLDNVEKIYSLCPEAKIIVVLRNQLSIVNSAYRTYIKAGGVWSFPRYAQEIIKCKKYNYAELLSKYFRLFGKENCLVLLYENLLTNPVEYINTILSFIGVSSPKQHDLKQFRPGPTKYYNECLRWVNIGVKIIRDFSCYGRPKSSVPSPAEQLAHRVRHFLRLWGVVFDNRIIKKIFSSGAIRKQFGYSRVKDSILSAYSDSNRKLEVMLNKDLKKYGYM